jgi:hypothetical protein
MGGGVDAKVTAASMMHARRSAQSNVHESTNASGGSSSSSNDSTMSVGIFVGGDAVRSVTTGGTVEVHAACGPTHDQQPVFRWDAPSVRLRNVSHVGLPVAFAFDYVVVPSR